MTLKSSVVVGVICFLIGALGGVFGGFFIRDKAKPETVNHITNIDNKTTVNQSQITRTDVMQGQVLVEIEGDRTNRVIYVQINNLTNVVVRSTTNTNLSYSVTN